MIRRINPLEDADWDAKVAKCPGASFFHGSAWARVLRDTYGFSPGYFVEDESGCLRSLLPMVEVNSWLTGRRGASLPFTDECAPLGATPEAFSQLWAEALAFAQVRGWKYVECRGGRSHFDDAPASTSYLGHRLDLRESESALMARLDSAVRRSIRKAEQSKLTVEFSQTPQAVQEFYRLLCITRQRHGRPPQPFRFFENIHRHILTANQGTIVLVRLGSAAIAAAVFFHFGNTALYKFGASDDAFQQLRPNNKVMWEAIKRHHQLGFETMDFGRTSPNNEGLRRFKLGWGTKEHSIDYVRYDCRTARFVTTGPESSGWQNRAFRRVPLWASRLLGAALYRHIA